MFSYKITSPTDARKGFFQLLDQVAENHQVFIINRRGGENVALTTGSDLTSLTVLLPLTILDFLYLSRLDFGFSFIGAAFQRLQAPLVLGTLAFTRSLIDKSF